MIIALFFTSEIRFTVPESFSDSFSLFNVLAFTLKELDIENVLGDTEYDTEDEVSIVDEASTAVECQKTATQTEFATTLPSFSAVI